ncbi:hypothetical protein C8Q79DRAFT_1012765 [Trametes meyenii]|nr:hypothetical protein C8Q79DRAFT_1012765 [Trametes meyenii]
MARRSQRGRPDTTAPSRTAPMRSQREKSPSVSPTALAPKVLRKKSRQHPEEKVSESDSDNASRAGSLDDTQVTHHYNTRRSTQTAHPARAVGLHKRTREEIAEQAARKAAVTQAKQRQQEQDATRLVRGIQKIAELEDSRQREDAETERYLHDGSPARDRDKRASPKRHRRAARTVHTLSRDPDCVSDGSREDWGGASADRPGDATDGDDGTLMAGQENALAENPDGAPRSRREIDWDTPTDTGDELGTAIRRVGKVKRGLGKAAAQTKKKPSPYRSVLPSLSAFERYHSQVALPLTSFLASDFSLTTRPSSSFPTFALALAFARAFALAFALTLALVFARAFALALPFALTPAVSLVADALTIAISLTISLAFALAFTLALAIAISLALAVPISLALAVPISLALAVPISLAFAVAVTVAVAVALPVAFSLAFALALAFGFGFVVAVGFAAGFAVGLTVEFAVGFASPFAFALPLPFEHSASNGQRDFDASGWCQDSEGHYSENDHDTRGPKRHEALGANTQALEDVSSNRTRGSRLKRKRDASPLENKSDSDRGRDSESEGSNEHPDAGHVRRTTASQRKRKQRATIRGQIKSFRRQSSERHERSASSSPAVPNTKSNARKASKHSAFRSDWLKKRAGPAHSSTNRPKTRRSLTRNPRSSEDSRSDSDDNNLGRDAFDDAAVKTRRSYAIKVAASRRRKTGVITELIDDEDASEVEQSGSKPPKKRVRRSPSEMPEEKSRSAANVPAFIKPHLTTHIIPTVLEYFGAKKNPWNTQEHGRNELLGLCQELIDEVCPHVDYELTKTDIVYKVIQQAIYDWRAGFANTTVAAVEDMIDHKFGPKASRKVIKLWVRKAISPGGESLWAKPDTRPLRAHGSLGSVYVLKALAHHLTVTEGSLRDYGWPRGALALAATAVQHIFPMFQAGAFKPGKAFSAANVEVLTDSWYRKSIRRFVKKPKKFRQIIQKATSLMNEARVRKVPVGGPVVDDIFDRSSPPLSDSDSSDYTPFSSLLI